MTGYKLYGALENEEYVFHKIVFQKRDLVPDEKAITYILTEMPKECDLLIAVGSGTINDLCRFVSFKVGIDYFIVGTAPSMDGYASTVSALIINHLKTTYETHCAKAIIGDLNVIAEAPVPMIATGIGDILGKYVCLTDWKIAHIINGEYICEEVVGIVERCIQKVVQSAKSAGQRNIEAIESIMEGLILTGIAMSYIGNSRPASGSEHHMSHYWEMMFLLKREPDPLHGTKVGIGTVVAIRLYRMLREKQNLFPLAEYKFDFNMWEKEIVDAYGLSATGVIELERKLGKNAVSDVLERREKFKEKQEEIFALIDKLPDEEYIIDILKTVNAPFYPKQIGIDKDVFRRSIYYAKELRNRFGLLQIVFDLGLREEFCDRIIEEIY